MVNVGVVISLYDEYDLVKSTCENILSEFSNAKIVLVESNVDKTHVYDNISDHIHLKNVYEFYKETIGDINEFRYRWMSHSLTRNFSVGFKRLYEIGDNYDLVVGLLGDTLIHDASFFVKINDVFKKDKKIIAGLQPIGQTLHHRLNVIETNYYYKNIPETDNSTVISPVFFIADGDFAFKNKLFTEIINTNELTFEQSLGDNVKFFLKDFQKKFLRLNKNKFECYSFMYDGISFHAKNNRPGRETY